MWWSTATVADRKDQADTALAHSSSSYAGEFTRNHQMEWDRAGAIYTSEDYRVQKFKIVNGVKP